MICHINIPLLDKNNIFYFTDCITAHTMKEKISICTLFLFIPKQNPSTVTFNINKNVHMQNLLVKNKNTYK